MIGGNGIDRPVGNPAIMASLSAASRSGGFIFVLVS